VSGKVLQTEACPLEGRGWLAPKDINIVSLIKARAARENQVNHFIFTAQLQGNRVRAFDIKNAEHTMDTTDMKAAALPFISTL
jgi:hypothetical protein